jgi:hypothetical protein
MGLEGAATTASSTRTIPGRSMCASCADAAMRGFILELPMPTASEQTPAGRGEYPKHLIMPKADRADREPVVRGQLAEAVVNITEGHGLGPVNTSKGDGTSLRENRPRENAHPTVKPVDLMRHLVRLVTPAGGTVLDPFLGSGSTAIAAELEGFPWVGIEKEPEYVAIAEARLHGTQRGLGLDVPAPTRQQAKPAGYTGERHPGREWTKWREAGENPEDAA